MKKTPLITYPLWALVIFGFVGVAKVSIDNFIGAAACPDLLSVPVCYVVTVAYVFMLASLITNHNGCKHHFFCIGWGTAFVIALLASLAEMFGVGGVCPSSSGGIRAGTAAGIPLCYISLVILVLILVLFLNQGLLKGPYQNACDIYNSQK